MKSDSSQETPSISNARAPDINSVLDAFEETAMTNQLIALLDGREVSEPSTTRTRLSFLYTIQGEPIPMLTRSRYRCRWRRQNTVMRGSKRFCGDCYPIMTGFLSTGEDAFKFLPGMSFG
jgi:hypothetical protein